MNGYTGMSGIIILNGTRCSAIGYCKDSMIKNGGVHGVPLHAVPASDGIAVQAESNVVIIEQPPFVNGHALLKIIVAFASNGFDFTQRGDTDPCYLFTVGFVAAITLTANAVCVRGPCRVGKGAYRHKSQHKHKAQQNA